MDLLAPEVYIEPKPSPEEQLQGWLQILAEEPRFARARMAWARQLVHEGKNEEALLQMRRTVQDELGVAEWHGHLAHLLKSMGQLQEAIAAMRQAISAAPNTGFYHEELAELLLETKDYDGAIAEYRAAIPLDPIGPYSIYNKIGNLLAERGDFAAAAIEYRQAIQAFSTDPIAYYNLGNALWELGDLDGAIHEYRRAILVADKTSSLDNEVAADAHHNMGLILFRKGDRDGALAAYREAIRLNPDVKNAYVEVAMILAMQGQIGEAIKELQGRIRGWPDFSSAKNSLAWIHATSRDPQYFDPVAAVNYAREAVEASEWKNASYIDTLAIALYANGQTAEANVSLAKALEIAPSEPILHEHLEALRKGVLPSMF
jgi:superkiller protein 3